MYAAIDASISCKAVEHQPCIAEGRSSWGWCADDFSFSSFFEQAARSNSDRSMEYLDALSPWTWLEVLTLFFIKSLSDSIKLRIRSRNLRVSFRPVFG